jgi:20S proteasome alpha/beta subunit
MTICIGALCADLAGNPSKGVIVASDRMVTLAGLTEFEHEVPKITAITDKIVALIAGDALRGSRLIREVSSGMPASPLVQAVAEGTANRYAELRKEQTHNDVFRPRAITIDDFYQNGIQQQMNPVLVSQIDNYVANFDYAVSLLVAGVDDIGSHLFSIANPGGGFNDHQPIGYHAIGSGWIHALQSIIGFGHTGARGLHETIFTVYASKRRAEVAPGVGHDTDMMIVTQEGVTRVEQSVLAELGEIFDEFQKPVSQEIKTKVSTLKFFKEVKQDDTDRRDSPK